ncbi:MAG: LysR family transcriptional regulator [Deltaproteobacteria bacterium]|nr:LysR family transcriptional regulator [Deltaproteobacteria bacterium]
MAALPPQIFRPERLVALVEVVRHEGFSRAARALGRTQSSLSQAIAALEADTGTALLVRDGRRTRPTAAGKVLLVRAERVLAELDLAGSELAALADLTAGRLVVGTTDTLAMHVLPPVLGELRRRHPGVELVLDHRPSPAIAARVASGDADVGIVTLPLPRDLELRIEPLAPLPDVLVCPRGHRLATRDRVTASDLAKEPLLLLDRGTGARAHLDAWFASRHVAPRVAMEMSSVEVLLRLVEHGLGVTIVPEVAVASRALVTVPLAGLTPRAIGLATPTAGAPSPATRAFVEIVHAKLRLRHR